MLGALPGRTAHDTVAGLLPAAGFSEVTTEVAWIRAREEATVDSVTEIPGARRLLTSLPAHTSAVVTSAGRTMTERRLTAAGPATAPAPSTANSSSAWSSTWGKSPPSTWPTAVVAPAGTWVPRSPMAKTVKT
ncbi:HAD family hydrolase [Streptomyces cellulosae]|uniref:hypothetical protein n=1 Tax=Streptomyces cellulosae TaxID=1968 RepID=UPI00068C2FCC|nr:hypothetical protein [Streptomyces cellulosae]